MPRFWLDANVLIEAHNRSYPYDVAVTFWTRMAEQIERGNIVCPRRVYQELAEHEKHQDRVAEFVRNRRGRGLCIAPSRDVMQKVGEIESYVFSAYPAPLAWHFSKGGDPWVIAHAYVDGGIVATYESALRPESKKPRVPDICRYFGVAFVGTLEMFRRLGVKF
jgi:Domain of unknown function (DUF4411)